MTELLRNIGGLEARMEEHDRRFDQLEKKVDDGFSGIYRRLDDLKDTESRRKGAMGVLKLLFGAGTLTGLWEVIKGILHK